MTIPTFPSLVGLGWPVVRSVMRKTLVQEAISGKETRLQQWAYSKSKWSVSFGVLRTAAAWLEFQQLFAFFNQVAGMGLPFHYPDAVDNAVTSQSFGVGDGSTTTFQLVRSLGGNVEPVQDPTTITTVAVNGTPTGAYTLGNAGLITFSAAPASSAALTWTGTYTFLCRMAQDNADFSMDLSGFYSMKKLEFQQILL